MAFSNLGLFEQEAPLPIADETHIVCDQVSI